MNPRDVAESLAFVADVLGGDDVAMSAARVEAVGPLLPTLRLVGMTMRVANPEFIANTARYSRLVRSMQVLEKSLAQAKRTLATFDRPPTYGCFTVERYDDMLTVTENDIAAVYDNGTIVMKPPAVEDARNQRIRNMLLAVIDVTVDNAALDAATNDMVEEYVVSREANKPADELRAYVQPIIDTIVATTLVKFTHAINMFTWAETPLTLEELKVAFDASLVIAFKDLSSNDDEYEMTPLERYNASIASAMPVTRMWGWYEAFRVQKLADVALAPAVEIARVTETLDTMARALRDTLFVDDKPYPDVEARDKALHPNDDRRAAEFLDTVIATLKLEALIRQVGRNDKQLSDVDLMELRQRQAARLAAIDPSEEEMRTRRVRLLDVASGLRVESEARIARVQYELGKMPVAIEVPLQIERAFASTSPLVLSLRVENAPADSTYKFEWFRDEDRVAEINNDTGETTLRRAADDTAGVYYVNVAVTSGGVTTTLHSSDATVRVIATCVRCDGAKFDVNEPRAFGECIWRAHPIDKTILDMRRAYDHVLPQLGFVDTSTGYREDLDDSVGMPDDASLLNLSLMSKEQLRAQFFTLAAVVRAMANRTADFHNAVVAAITPALASEFEVPQNAVIAAAEGATTLARLPLIALIGVASPPVATHSEHRFMGIIKTRFLAFVRLYRYAMAFAGDSADKIASEVAAMTEVDVRTSDVWYVDMRRHMVFGDMKPSTMFIDEDGETRLQARIATVLARHDRLQCTYSSIEYLYATDIGMRTREIDTLEDLGTPFGVPERVWHAPPPPALHLHLADWRGEHSHLSTQPVPYQVIKNAGMLSIVRGSERLRAGYDFDGLHTMIQSHVRDVNAAYTDEGEARVMTLVMYFNVLAQFAPALSSLSVIPATEIVARLDKFRIVA